MCCKPLSCTSNCAKGSTHSNFMTTAFTGELGLCTRLSRSYFVSLLSFKKPMRQGATIFSLQTEQLSVERGRQVLEFGWLHVGKSDVRPTYVWLWDSCDRPNSKGLPPWHEVTYIHTSGMVQITVYHEKITKVSSLRFSSAKHGWWRDVSHGVGLRNDDKGIQELSSPSGLGTVLSNCSLSSLHSQPLPPQFIIFPCCSIIITFFFFKIYLSGRGRAGGEGES